jgi:hypothetical protein
MNNRERFFDAFAHGPHDVMGRRMAKFTLRHRFWLEVFHSPIVDGGDVGMVDVEMCSRLCAIPFPELDERVPHEFGRRTRWWERMAFAWRTWRRRTGDEYEALLHYLIDHGNSPAVHENVMDLEGEPDPHGPPLPPDELVRRRKRKRPDSGAIPGLLHLVTGLVRRSGWDPDVVWGLGPGEAEWYLTGVLLHDGVKVPVKSASDEEFEAGIRAEREAARKGEAVRVEM